MTCDPTRDHHHPGTTHHGDGALFTRRSFLGSSLVAVSTASLTPSFLARTAYAAASEQATQPVGAKPGVPEDRVLVVIELAGGNDGLNAVPPFGFDAYYTARPGIALRASDVVKVSGIDGVGLHTNMPQIAAMIEAGRGAVVMGAGYPEPNRSHFVSMDIWHTADPSGGRGLGWLGRALDETPQSDADAGAALIAFGSTSPLAGQGRRHRPITFESPQLFQWAGESMHPEIARRYEQIMQGAATTPAGGGASEFLRRTAMSAQLVSEQVRRAVSVQPLTSFPGGALGGQLRQVAAMIRAEMPTRIYYTRLGGFDTHAGQPGQHANLLGQFSQAVNGFYAELDAMGQSSRVMTLAFSEFGRRVQQNASQGTDHGTAGPMFLFGPMVRAGMLGQYPSLTQLDDGDLVFTVDFREVYAGVLKDWMNLKPDAVLGGSFRPAKVLA